MFSNKLNGHGDYCFGKFGPLNSASIPCLVLNPSSGNPFDIWRMIRYRVVSNTTLSAKEF